jgi:1-pyrroline-5-carboxylate dehydrogenase
MLPEFRNEPFTDFSVPENQAAFRAALTKVKSELGRTYPLVINGRRIESDTVFTSINPARPEEVIGYFAKGDAESVDQAVAAAAAAFKTWQYVAPEERARYLLRVAAEIRRRKHEFNAVMVLEVGKSWFEADADTAETIDFLEYYARQMIRIADASAHLTPYPPEHLALHYIPLGVGAVIPPWNFPCAIPTGLIAASIVAGNTVVFKPASQSMLCGYKIAEVFWDVGLPPGVLNFVTGPGELLGSRMVEHPQTRFIGFTGSKEVGIEIFNKASVVQPGQLWLKRTILEMGGKDAVLVDETANLESAAQGIVSGAFGYQGQKCSAGSRAIIVGDVYDQVAGRVVQLAKELSIGPTDESNEIDMGPVIDKDAMQKIMDYIEIGTQEGRLLLGGQPLETPSGGYFIPPTIFGDVPGDARIAQEEIFGPVLTLIRAHDFDEALTIANSTEYGLTGSLYSQNGERLERARREFHVGNLYLNRKSTGALVGVHPFGGFNMSGTDSKTGGPDYLLLFTQAKSIAEKL